MKNPKFKYRLLASLIILILCSTYTYSQSSVILCNDEKFRCVVIHRIPFPGGWVWACCEHFHMQGGWDCIDDCPDNMAIKEDNEDQLFGKKYTKSTQYNDFLIIDGDTIGWIKKSTDNKNPTIYYETIPYRPKQDKEIVSVEFTIDLEKNELYSNFPNLIVFEKHQNNGLLEINYNSSLDRIIIYDIQGTPILNEDIPSGVRPKFCVSEES